MEVPPKCWQSTCQSTTEPHSAVGLVSSRDVGFRALLRGLQASEGRAEAVALWGTHSASARASDSNTGTLTFTKCLPMQAYIFYWQNAFLGTVLFN